MIRRFHIALFAFSIIGSSIAFGQDDKVKFSGYARGLQQNNALGEKDTFNVDRTSGGYTLVDLGVNAHADAYTEVAAIIRFRSDLGGFYGAGATAQLRQMYVKGVVGKVLSYRVGDMYLKLSPYTLFNSDPEGINNEARVFSDFRRDVTYYENFNNFGNSWWQQGAHTNFALAFEELPIQKVSIDAFFLRNRNSGFFTTPSPNTFYSGGRFSLQQSKYFTFNGNYVNMFDIGATVGVMNSARNPVVSGEALVNIDSDKSKLNFNLEGGFSNLVFKLDTAVANLPAVLPDSSIKNNGFFVDAGTKYTHKKSRITVGLNYRFVSDKFYSAGAQSKRINYNSVPQTFPSVGNDPFNPIVRGVSVFDAVRDDKVYNTIITRQLMAYDPRFSNAMPYGLATPNRQGFTVDLGWKDSLEIFNINVSSSYLTEVNAEISINNTRSFLLGSLKTDLAINKLIGFKRNLLLTAGYKMENTSRAGDSTGFTLNTNLIDLGLEVEVLKKFDLLLGMKMLSSSGEEMPTVRNIYNEIVSPGTTKTKYNNTQALYGGGVKYRFSSNTYVTVQDHYYLFNDKDNNNGSYSFNQLLFLFNMNF